MASDGDEQDRPAVVLVAGPTASGKSGLALAIARELRGVVINADAMQVYRDLEILTARPGLEATAAVPHRLYGFLDAEEACSAGRWRAFALAEIEAALAAGRLPVVAGGTGLYLKALEEGLAPLPEVPEGVRAEARARHAELGGAAFHAALAERDPAMAQRLHPSDSQRLIRAWEVLEASGRSLAQWQAEAEAEPAPYRFLRFSLLPEREALYATCDRRFEAMVEAGALEEAAALAARDLDPALPIMKALGLRPLLAHLAGEIDLAEAVGRGQTETRRYAKRQMTWLRTQVPAGQPLQAGSPPPDARQGCVRSIASSWAIHEQFSESMNREIFSIIRDFRLTP